MNRHSYHTEENQIMNYLFKEVTFEDDYKELGREFPE
jgi:hypothetical protein